MGKVLGIIYRAIATHLIHKAGLKLKDGTTGAVTLVQRLGSALNLTIHFHTYRRRPAKGSQGLYDPHHPPTGSA